MKQIRFAWLIFIIIVAAILIYCIWTGDYSFMTSKNDRWFASGVVSVAGLFLYHFYHVIVWLTKQLEKIKFTDKDHSDIDWDHKNKPKVKYNNTFFTPIKKYLTARYGLFWRQKVQTLLVLGDPSDIQKISPELLSSKLQSQTWLVGDNMLLIWGGKPDDEIDKPWLKALKKCCGKGWLLRRKPLDGVIWLVPEDYTQQGRRQQILLEKTVMQMRVRNRILGWEAPLYLLDVRTSDGSQEDRINQSVGAIFNQSKACDIPAMLTALEQVSQRCTTTGMEQVVHNSRHAFLLTLARDIQQKDIPLLQKWLTQLTSLPKYPLLRGLFYTPPAVRGSDEAIAIGEHQLPRDVTWQAIKEDSEKNPGRRIGINWTQLTCALVFTLSGLSALGIVTSYVNNRQLIADSTELVRLVESSIERESYPNRLAMQYQLQLQMEMLIYRHNHSAPWYHQFGLNKNDPLLDKIWPHYQQINDVNVIKPFSIWLHNYLVKIGEISPSAPERGIWYDKGYDILKSYLMLGMPAKADGHYLDKFVTHNWPHPSSVNSQEWQKLMPTLIKFWGQSLPQHPQWALALDPDLVKGTRQILINYIGVQNAEDTIYNSIIERVSKNYADQTLSILLNGIDSRSLFWTEATVPGVFTRKAWDDIVEDDIENAAKSRQEQIDWVLSDEDKMVTSSISSESLREQLRERYFSDYGANWLGFLNSIRWQQAYNVADVIEQLSLLSDTRRSPLIALMNVIKYQSEVAYSGGTLTDDLLRSAQDLVSNKNKIPQVLPEKSEASGPLTVTFAPVMSLLNSDNSNNLSLQTYLLRVTQVRLKLQNITSSANPQAMTQAFAKSIFQGTSVDLADTRDYGNLVAANLGEEWSGLGHSMFVQPLEQSWQVILTPAAKSFNETWQDNIVLSWEKSFAGRYPFKNSDNDASLAELARFLRPESGVLDKFITSQLGGVIKKQGDQWVADPINAQGLTFAPEFLDALALFGEISTELLSSGDTKIAFDLMPRSGSGILRSELFVDKQSVIYFNQMPTWKRIIWPGNDYSPFAQLSWSTDDTGLRLYGYYAGDWGWIRLLEQAAIKQIDSSRYEVIWTTPQQDKLRYILRTQAGSGPVTLLKLRNFSLPSQVFATDESL